MVCNPLLQNCNQVSQPENYFNSVVQTIIGIFFIFAVIYFIWHFILASFRYITSEGDDKKISQAKTDITNTIVGLAIVFCVFAVLKFIGTVLGIQGLDQLRLSWPSL